MLKWQIVASECRDAGAVTRSAVASEPAKLQTHHVEIIMQQSYCACLIC